MCMEKNLSFIGFPNYSITDDGRVYSLNYRRSHKKVEKKQRTNRDGYKYINLHNNTYRKTFKVHRLVALAFIPNPENKPEIDHINTIKSDNRLENLRWVTGEENNLNPLTQLHIKINKKRGDKRKKVNKYSLNGDYITTYDSVSEAAKSVGCVCGNFSSYIKRNPRYKGYIWEYATKDRV